MCQPHRLWTAPPEEAITLQRVNERSTRDLFFNDYWCVVIDEIEQLNDIRVSHPNATTAGWAANLTLMFCAMYVNESVARVSIVLVQSVQP